MATALPNQFYKFQVNGEDYVEALPSGYAPPGHKAITPQQVVEWYNAARPELKKWGQSMYDQALGGLKASGYSNLSPEEMKQYGFDSPFVMTSKFDEARQQASDVASGKMVQVGTAANGQPLYAPKGSPAAISAAGGTPSYANISPEFVAANPTLEIPSTIPSGALKTSATSGTLLQQSQANQPKIVSTVPMLTENLKPGSSGQQVVDLQKYLVMNDAGPAARALGSAFSRGTQYGFYGDLTKSAVAEWQKAQQSAGKMGAIPQGQEGYFGPLSRESLAKLSTAVSEATAKAPDAASALKAGNDALTAAGKQPLSLLNTDNISKDSIAGAIASYINLMNDHQTKLNEAQAALTDQLSAYKRGQSKIEGQTIAMPLIGRQLDALKQTVETQIQPYQDAVANLTAQIGLDKEMFSTLVAYGQYVKGLEDDLMHLDLGDRVAMVDKKTGQEVRSYKKGATPGSGLGSLYDDSDISGVATRILPFLKNSTNKAQRAQYMAQFSAIASNPDPSVQQDALKSLAENAMQGMFPGEGGIYSAYTSTASMPTAIDRAIAKLEALGSSNTGPYKNITETAKPFVGMETDPDYAELKSIVENDVAAPLRKARAGLSLTGYELKSAENYLPAWGKDDYTKILTKLKTLKGDIGIARDAAIEYTMYGSYSGLGGSTGTQPPPPASMSISDDFGAAEASAGIPVSSPSTQQVIGTTGGIFSTFWDALQGYFNKPIR